MLCSCCVYSFFILYMLYLLYWWCCYFLRLFFVGAVNFRAWYFLAGWFFVGCCFLWCDGFLVLVSVGFCSVFLAFGCCGLLFLYWGVGWFGGLVFVGFLGFCRVLPVCTVSILRVFIFFWGWLTVQLKTSTRLIFIFLKALEWMRLLNYCNFIF